MIPTIVAATAPPNDKECFWYPFIATTIARINPRSIRMI